MEKSSMDVSNKLNGMASQIKNKIITGENQLEVMAQHAGERVGEMASNFADSTADSMKASRDFVKENPIKGVAIAAAAGLVVGGLLTMAFRGRKD